MPSHKYPDNRSIYVPALIALGAIVAGAAIIRFADARPALTTPTDPSIPTLDDFWEGRAHWELEIQDTGLPVGESDTLVMGDGVYWSYLHASAQSAGVVDSCGDPVSFPGCITRWVSTDGGKHFTLGEPECLMECNRCPCEEEDKTWQQQYPRVARSPSGKFYMVFEHGAAAWIATSWDGITWLRPRVVPYTGVWMLSEGECTAAQRIGPHPFIPPQEDDCMAGGPPGMWISDTRIYVFVGFGQNPGHLGCFWSFLMDSLYFTRCSTDALITGSPEYGPFDALGAPANPYFDFRYITSADVTREGETYYYMTYEGARGPDSAEVGGDNQFALGLARSGDIDRAWEEYPGNPMLDDVSNHVGIGHADLVIDGGITYLYTGTPDYRRGRYILAWNEDAAR